MDFFKIVATKEKNGIYFSVVPHQWEQDKVLYWPGHLNHSRRESLRSDPSSTPEENWLNFPCIVKISNINNFREALQIEKQLTDCSDTEAEEVLFNNIIKKRGASKTKTVSQVTDRNDMFSEWQSCKNTNNVSPTIDETVIVDVTRNLDNSIDDDFVKCININPNNSTNKFVIVDKSGIVDINVPNESQTSEAVTDVVTIKEDIISIKNNISTLKKELKEQYIKIHLCLDKTYKMISDNNQSVIKGACVAEQKPKEDLLKNFNFPLSTCQEISRLDYEVRKKDDFYSQLVEFLSQIGGVKGEEDGGKIAYKMVDYIFSSDVLNNYSWTGVSREKSIQKISFQSLEGIIELFFEVLLLADNRHTKQKNASIFKDGVLKHAKKRSLRKRIKAESGEKCNTGIDIAEVANTDDILSNITEDIAVEANNQDIPSDDDELNDRVV